MFFILLPGGGGGTDRSSESWEMSITGTDCQFPGCVYTASVYTYPYCHEHEAYASVVRAQSIRRDDRSTNPQREYRKSASLTEYPAQGTFLYLLNLQGIT